LSDVAPEEDQTSLPPVERLARRISHHVHETHKANAKTETARRREAQAELAVAMRAELSPALAGMVSQLLEALPEDHALRKLVELLGSPIDDLVAFIFELFGAIPAILDLVMSAGHILAQPVLNNLWSKNTNIPLPPAVLADMVERNIIGQQYGEEQAALSGLSPDYFDLMVKDTGEPYGIMEALALLRRKAITLDQFTKILYYSRVRNEFLPDVLELRYNYMSPADAVEIALKGIQPEATAREMFTTAGGLEENWTDLLAAAGNPIGVVNAVNQYYHHIIGYPEVKKVIAHSRINPMFEHLALNEHLKWLTATQIHQALKAGSITPATARGWLITNGYDAEQAAAFAGSATQVAVEGSKHLNVSTIKELYAEGTLKPAQAETALEQLGYSKEDTAYMLSLEDAQVKIQETKRAVNRIRALYLAHRLNSTEATNNMIKLGVPEAARRTYLSIWDDELAGVVRVLSEAQVGRLYARGKLTSAETRTRFEKMGFSLADADLLIEDYSTTKSLA